MRRSILMASKHLVMFIALIVFNFGPARADDLGPPLRGSEITAVLVGTKVNGISPQGDQWSALYKPNGDAEYGDGNTGRWRVSGDRFCDHPKGGEETCVEVYKLSGHKYQFMRGVEKKGSTVKVE